jgi:hypothetical protein
MVFGEPETPESVPLRMARQIQRIAERLCSIATKIDGRKIKNG